MLFAFVMLSLNANAINITIGTGTGTNSPTTYPTPYGNWYWGAKHQFIITANELTSAGMSAGNILSLSFDVANAEGSPLDGFQISLGTTSKSDWGFGDDFETALTTVYGPLTYTETNGINTHTFATPYYWDGVSNLVVETCFNNTAFTNNATVYSSTTTQRRTMFTNQDASGVCGFTTGNFDRSFERPNMIFDWQVPTIPPDAAFNSSTTVTCNGTVTFYDNSSNSPTSWLWDFGDGNTSTAQNPTHTYAADGQYTVELTATNQYGSDTETVTNYITVNVSGGTPVANSCTPNTIDGSLGFGITELTFNTLTKISGDASEGYSDFTCDQTIVFAGQTYSFSATHAAPTTHNLAAWIDWNNDGVFNPTNEEIITSNSSLTTSGNITIPSNAVLNTPLRMRVSVDYDLNAVPTPCSDPQYGQTEDYTIIVEQEMNPPSTDFVADVLVTCDGEVNFTDQSTNIPYAWAWDFGDGTTSVQVNPSYTYTTDGFYTVQLITTNAFGSDTLIQTNYIEVATSRNLVSASCAPNTIDYCCGYGIYKVAVNSINNSSVDAQEGYQDYSCQHFTTLEMGSNYQMEVRTGTDNPQDTKVWIDYNDDGIFDNSTELVATALNDYNPVMTISIPSTGAVSGKYIRMRVSSDELGGTLDACTDHLRGQTEDYGIMLDDPDAISETSFEFNVFPNPSNGTINIDCESGIQEISILSSVGQIVHSERLNNNTNKVLDLSHLSKGQYLVQIKNDSESIAIKKVIIL